MLDRYYPLWWKWPNSTNWCGNMLDTSVGTPHKVIQIFELSTCQWNNMLWMRAGRVKSEDLGRKGELHSHSLYVPWPQDGVQSSLWN